MINVVTCASGTPSRAMATGVASSKRDAEADNVAANLGRSDPFIRPSAQHKLVEHAGLTVGQHQPFDWQKAGQQRGDP
jgi:hypothetical protein